MKRPILLLQGNTVLEKNNLEEVSKKKKNKLNDLSNLDFYPNDIHHKIVELIKSKVCDDFLIGNNDSIDRVNLEDIDSSNYYPFDFSNQIQKSLYDYLDPVLTEKEILFSKYRDLENTSSFELDHKSFLKEPPTVLKTNDIVKALSQCVEYMIVNRVFPPWLKLRGVMKTFRFMCQLASIIFIKMQHEYTDEEIQNYGGYLNKKLNYDEICVLEKMFLDNNLY